MRKLFRVTILTVAVLAAATLPASADVSVPRSKLAQMGIDQEFSIEVEAGAESVKMGAVQKMRMKMSR